MLNDQLMVAVFGFWLLLLWWLLSWQRTGLLEPGKAFLVGWLLIVFFHAANLVVYDQVFNARAVLSLLAGTGAFVLGALAVRSYLLGDASTGPARPARPMQPMWWGTTAFVVASVLGYALMQVPRVAQVLATGGLTAATLLELRAEHIAQSLEARVTPASAAEAVLRVGATMAAVGVPIFMALRQRWLVILGLVAILVLALDSALIGGRMLIAYVVLGVVYARLHCAPPRNVRGLTSRDVTRLSLTLLAFAGLGYVMMVLFPALRNPDLASDVDFFLGLLHEARLSDWVVAASDYVPAGGLLIFAFASSYISQPIVKYTFFLENSDIESWLTLGAYNFPLISKAVSMLQASSNEWAEIRERLAMVSARFGYGENPWATSVRDLVIDFGLWGMPLAMFVLGALAQYLFLRASGSRRAEWRIALALAGPMIFFMAFFSPLPVGIFGNTLLAAIGWAVLAGAVDGPRSRAGQGDSGPSGATC